MNLSWCQQANCVILPEDLRSLHEGKDGTKTCIEVVWEYACVCVCVCLCLCVCLETQGQGNWENSQESWKSWAMIWRRLHWPKFLVTNIRIESDSKFIKWYSILHGLSKSAREFNIRSYPNRKSIKNMGIALGKKLQLLPFCLA